MDYEITREQFYLYHALKILNRGGYHPVSIYYHTTIGTPYLVYRYGGLYYIRNINMNSIELSIMELTGLHASKFITDTSDWMHVETLEHYISIETLLLSTKEYAQYGEHYLFRVHNDAIAIVITYPDTPPA